MMLVMRFPRLGVLLALIALIGTVVAVRVLVDQERPDAEINPAATRPVRLVRTPLVQQLVGTVTGLLSTRTIDPGAFRQVAVTWRGELSGALELRTRTDGAWTGWRELEPSEDRGQEGNGTSGTDLLWVGQSDRAQVRVDGAAPRRLALVAVDPGYLPSDEAAGGDEGLRLAAGTVTTRETRAPRPDLLTREDWGANESWRTSAPTYSDQVKQVHVHHTASSNDYTKTDVPAMLRGMYRYHTQSLGWSDIGYNFLIDKWGRAWIGRWGGATRPVRGAHTLGFNENSVGIALIGNYEKARPTSYARTKLVRMAAWKLDRYGHDPASVVWVRSAGSDRYPAGTGVRLHRIDGHRDTNQTACPGRYLYEVLPGIRLRAQERVDRY